MKCIPFFLFLMYLFCNTVRMNMGNFFAIFVYINNITCVTTMRFSSFARVMFKMTILVCMGNVIHFQLELQLGSNYCNIDLYNSLKKCLYAIDFFFFTKKSIQTWVTFQFLSWLLFCLHLYTGNIKMNYFCAVLVNTNNITFVKIMCLSLFV